MSRRLKAAGWSVRKNSVGQTVPENWRELAEADAARICKRFKDENVDMTENSDQTFVNFFMEEEKVVAPTGTRRVGGKIQANVKKDSLLWSPPAWRQAELKLLL